MRYFQPKFIITVPIHAIVKQTERAILVQYKETTKEKNLVWFPRGWLYNIKYKKSRNNPERINITLEFYGFLEKEIKEKMRRGPKN